LISKLISVFARSKLSLPIRKILRKLRESYYNTEVLTRITQKTTPLSVSVSAQEKTRINIIIPEIDFNSFYGGYIAKFNLAKRLVELDYRVRFIIVDQCDYNLTKWKECISQYRGIETIFEDVEIAYCFERSVVVNFNPDDKVFATTWWTAYIANELMDRLNAEKFYYLIQEYEPFTFPMGSYFAVAHHSYSFSHKPLFSTDLLEEYFRINRIGYYSRDPSQIDDKAVTFQNAIISYQGSELRLESRKNNKLLFYARPEAHASRNMFEVAFSALQNAIRRGVFAAGDWEFYGIGTNHGDISLNDGHILKMLGKVGLEEYRELLLDFDIGMSLMYTPHPSLLPLEMAAAGMVVVTSECLNKTSEKMKAISGNILAGPPTEQGITDILGVAVSMVSNFKNRIQNSKVNWSSSWDETFSDDWFKQVFKKT